MYNLVSLVQFYSWKIFRILAAVCPSEKYRAVIREVTSGKDEKKQFLEIWDSNSLCNVVDLTTLDIHGSVYSDRKLFLTI